MQTYNFSIEGMHCASCAVRIQQQLSKHPGVQEATVNYALGQAQIKADDTVDVHALHQIVEHEGYRVPSHTTSHEEHAHTGAHDHGAIPFAGERKRADRRALLSGILALPVFLSAMGFLPLPALIAPWFEGILATIAVLGTGFIFHKAAFIQARRLTAGMDTLISLGTLVSLLSSWWAVFAKTDRYFETAAIITFFILLGKALEARSKGKAGEALQGLLSLGAKQAHLLRPDGNTQDVPLEQIRVGDHLLVKPGEKIPSDAIVRAGSSSVDESALTGESIPATKQIGDTVFAATINQDGSLTIEVTKPAGETVMARIIKLMQEAQMKRAPIQALADRVSAIFVPVVLGLSLVTFILWFLITKDVSVALIPAIAVLVIACPCALGLATPTAILVGTGRGARQGILIKSGEALERAHNISTVFFDKTGTLTQGKPTVAHLQSVQGSGKELLTRAASLARLSSHPLSLALALYAQKESIPVVPVDQFLSVTAKGVQGNIENILYRLGQRSWMEEQGVIFSSILEEPMRLWQQEGCTVLAFADEQNVLGLFALRDQVKDTAIQAIRDLHARGIETAMLTGDRQEVAEAIAQPLGITNIFAQVFPEQKLALVEQAQKEGKHVAFVGDGINDAPALTQADLGIAMGSGTDIALEAGQMVIIGSDPLKIPQAIALARRTYRIIKQNLFWAFLYNILAIPFAALGILTPVIASAAMAFSSVSVVLNSLRLRR